MYNIFQNNSLWVEIAWLLISLDFAHPFRFEGQTNQRVSKQPNHFGRVCFFSLCACHIYPRYVVHIRFDAENRYHWLRVFCTQRNYDSDKYWLSPLIGDPFATSWSAQPYFSCCFNCYCSCAPKSNDANKKFIKLLYLLCIGAVWTNAKYNVLHCGQFFWLQTIRSNFEQRVILWS